VHTVELISAISKSKPTKETGILGLHKNCFMRITHGFCHYSLITSYSYCPYISSYTSSSLRSQGSLQPKCAPAKDPDGWQKKGTRLATVSTHEKQLYSN
jgi:hypothetical protein